MPEFNPTVSIFQASAMALEKEVGFATRAIAIGTEIHEALAKIKPTPAVGHTCLIRHQVKRTSTGDVLGLQRADGKGIRVPITAVYLDGLVRTGTSDIWEVQPAGMNTWETINPNHGKSE